MESQAYSSSRFRSNGLFWTLAIGVFFVLLYIPALGYLWESKKARLRISVYPETAQVRIDGRLLEPPSLGFAAVEPRAHEILVQLENYRDEKRILDIRSHLDLTFRLVSPGSSMTFVNEFPCGTHPKEVSVSPDGKFLVITLLGGDGLDIYSIAERKIIRHIVPGPRASETGFVEGVFNAAGDEFWFSQMTTGMVYVLSWPSMEVKHSISNVGFWTKVIEFSPDGDVAYVSNWLGNDLAVIDTRTYRIIRKVPVDGKSPRGLAVTAGGRHLYVLCFDSYEILKYDTVTFEILKRIPLGGELDRIRLDRKREFAYFDNMRTRELLEFDTRTDAVTRRLPLWNNPNNVRLSPDEMTIYVACRGPNNPAGYLERSPENGRIYVIDRKTFRTREYFEGGNQCVGLSVTPDGKLLAFSNLQDSTVMLYETGDSPFHESL